MIILFIACHEKSFSFYNRLRRCISYAAIIAREMNTPCVITTKIATKVLKNGDMVEVNVENGGGESHQALKKVSI